jgi:hypothetical protein
MKKLHQKEAIPESAGFVIFLLRMPSTEFVPSGQLIAAVFKPLSNQVNSLSNQPNRILPAPQA